MERSDRFSRTHRIPATFAFHFHCIPFNRGEMRWRKVTLIGVGLLGGSLGMALRKHSMAGEVCGYVRRETSIDECERAGAVDRATTDLGSAVDNAEIIVLCTPLLQMGELSREIAPRVRQETLVTDVGSVKGAVVAELEPLFARFGATFVGSHPMAGSEKMGVSAARVDLFRDATCVVTPTRNSPPQQVAVTEALWKAVGGRVQKLSPELHDALVARSSHIPHVLAAQLARLVLDPANGPEQGSLCATGFRDSTRIASGSPEMWRDIVMMNGEQVLAALDQFHAELSRFKVLIEKRDASGIEDYFREAKALRDEWIDRCSTTTPE